MNGTEAKLTGMPDADRRLLHELRQEGICQAVEEHAEEIQRLQQDECDIAAGTVLRRERPAKVDADLAPCNETATCRKTPDRKMDAMNSAAKFLMLRWTRS